MTPRLVRFVEKIRKVRTSARRRDLGDGGLGRLARLLGADSLSGETLRKTLGALLKNREDLERVLQDPAKYR